MRKVRYSSTWLPVLKAGPLSCRRPVSRQAPYCQMVLAACLPRTVPAQADDVCSCGLSTCRQKSARPRKYQAGKRYRTVLRSILIHPVVLHSSSAPERESLAFLFFDFFFPFDFPPCSMSWPCLHVSLHCLSRCSDLSTTSRLQSMLYCVVQSGSINILLPVLAFHLSCTFKTYLVHIL